VRLSRCGVRDHINYRKKDRWRSYRFYRALRRLKSPMRYICEIFGAPRFSSFSTQSVKSRPKALLTRFTRPVSPMAERLAKTRRACAKAAGSNYISPICVIPMATSSVHCIAWGDGVGLAGAPPGYSLMGALSRYVVVCMILPKKLSGSALLDRFHQSQALALPMTGPHDHDLGGRFGRLNFQPRRVVWWKQRAA
jgi:hypothetical protein